MARNSGVADDRPDGDEVDDESDEAVAQEDDEEDEDEDSMNTDELLQK